MNVISQKEMGEWMANGDWLKLANIAKSMIDSVSVQLGGYPIDERLGGGTRLMISMAHRISHDIDIFIHDAQILSFFTPRLSSFQSDELRGYDEDSNYIKLKFDYGEIDIIVAPQLSGCPSEPSKQTGLNMEPVTEVITKKLYYRGNNLTARDLFDWRSVMKLCPNTLDQKTMWSTVKHKKSGIIDALNGMKEFHSARLSWDRITTPYPMNFNESIDWAFDEINRLDMNSDQPDQNRKPVLQAETLGFIKTKPTHISMPDESDTPITTPHTLLKPE